MAQSAPSTMGPSARFIPTVPANVTTVTNYFKQSVYDPSNNKIGNILDLMVEKDGRITAAMVGVGGFLGLARRPSSFHSVRLRSARKTTSGVLH